MVDFERRTIASFDGTPLGLVLAGSVDERAPLLLLANGLGANASAFQLLMNRFEDDFRIVTWDYRGLFSSGRPVRGYDGLRVEDHARDVAAVIDAVDPRHARDVHALGWSMGVQVLLESVKLMSTSNGHASTSFKSLVLHNGVPGRPWSTVARGTFRSFADRALVATQRADAVVSAAVKSVASSPRFIPLAVRLGLLHHDVDRAVFDDVARGFADVDMHVYLEILRRLGEHDAYDALPRVTCPTLVVQGTEDWMAPLPVAQTMAREIRNASLAVLPGGTHYASAEMPALFHDELAKFWRGVGALR